MVVNTVAAVLPSHAGEDADDIDDDEEGDSGMAAAPLPFRDVRMA